MSDRKYVQNLLDFIDASPSPWHAVDTLEKHLETFKFEKLDETQKWLLQPGGRYFVVRDDSSIILFIQGLKPLVETGFKIIATVNNEIHLRN